MDYDDLIQLEKQSFDIRAEERILVENRDLQDGEVVPACVQSCPSSALIFGDANNPQSQISQIIQNTTRKFRLLEDLGTEPSIYYLKGGDSYVS